MKAFSMNADSNETELERRALAIAVWENEGGARASDTPDDQFGRRVRAATTIALEISFTPSADSAIQDSAPASCAAITTRAGVKATPTVPVGPPICERITATGIV